MGRWAPEHYEKVLLGKCKWIIYHVLDQVKKENEGKDVISFEDFVEGLNTGDNFTKRVFEILIRETASSKELALRFPNLTNNNTSTSSNNPQQPSVAQRTIRALNSSYFSSNTTSSASSASSSTSDNTVRPTHVQGTGTVAPPAISHSARLPLITGGDLQRELEREATERENARRPRDDNDRGRGSWRAAIMEARARLRERAEQAGEARGDASGPSNGGSEQRLIIERPRPRDTTATTGIGGSAGGATGEEGAGRAGGGGLSTSDREGRRRRDHQNAFSALFGDDPTGEGSRAVAARTRAMRGLPSSSGQVQAGTNARDPASASASASAPDSTLAARLSSIWDGEDDLRWDWENAESGAGGREENDRIMEFDLWSGRRRAQRRLNRENEVEAGGEDGRLAQRRVRQEPQGLNRVTGSSRADGPVPEARRMFYSTSRGGPIRIDMSAEPEVEVEEELFMTPDSIMETLGSSSSVAALGSRASSSRRTVDTGDPLSIVPSNREATPSGGADAGASRHRTDRASTRVATSLAGESGGERGGGSRVLSRSAEGPPGAPWWTVVGNLPSPDPTDSHQSPANQPDNEDSTTGSGSSSPPSNTDTNTNRNGETPSADRDRDPPLTAATDREVALRSVNAGLREAEDYIRQSEARIEALAREADEIRVQVEERTRMVDRLNAVVSAQIANR